MADDLDPQKEYMSKVDFGYVWNEIKKLFTGKSDFETLSARVEEIIAEGGEPNVLESVKVNGTTLTPDTNKAVDVSVPTTVSELTDATDYAKTVDLPTAVSELTNDSGYQTASDVASAVANALDDVTGISYESVASLPATGEAGVIYLVPKTGGAGANVKDEYIWTGSAFEKIGDTEVDLSNYWGKDELVPMTIAEIDEILNS